jgi:hypothetical protein
LPKHLLIMLAECEPGKEAEFDDWYTNTHLAEIVRVPGFVSAQRFELSESDPPQQGIQRHLAVYEIEGDVAAAREALTADAPNRVDTVGLDRSQSKAAYFTAISERVTSAP